VGLFHFNPIPQLGVGVGIVQLVPGSPAAIQNPESFPWCTKEDEVNPNTSTQHTTLLQLAPNGAEWQQSNY
jgi:hypothetical protein